MRRYLTAAPIGALVILAACAETPSPEQLAATRKAAAERYITDMKTSIQLAGEVKTEAGLSDLRRKLAPIYAEMKQDLVVLDALPPAQALDVAGRLTAVIIVEDAEAGQKLDALKASNPALSDKVATELEKMPELAISKER